METPQLTDAMRARLNAKVREIFNDPQTATLAALAGGFLDDGATERRALIDAAQPAETLDDMRNQARYLRARLDRAETAMRDAARLLGQGGTRTGAMALLLGALQQ